MGALINVHDGVEPLVAAARTNPVALAEKVRHDTKLWSMNERKARR